MKRLAFALIITCLYTNLYGSPRGIRNNNPGNIVAGDRWLGRSGTDGRFVKFKSPEYGLRAIGKVINTYQKKHNINTIKGIITRWAPPIENNTSLYITYVCKHTGIKPNQPLNIFDKSGKLKKERELKLIISAIIKMENGSKYTYSNSTYSKAFKMLR